MEKLPERVLVYVCDEDADGTRILTVVEKLEDIPEDQADESVGVYTLSHVRKLTIKKTLL